MICSARSTTKPRPAPAAEEAPHESIQPRRTRRPARPTGRVGHPWPSIRRTRRGHHAGDRPQRHDPGGARRRPVRPRPPAMRRRRRSLMPWIRRPLAPSQDRNPTTPRPRIWRLPTARPPRRRWPIASHRLGRPPTARPWRPWVRRPHSSEVHTDDPTLAAPPAYGRLSDGEAGGNSTSDPAANHRAAPDAPPTHDPASDAPPASDALTSPCQRCPNPSWQRPGHDGGSR